MKPFKKAHSAVSVTGYETAHKVYPVRNYGALSPFINDHNHIHSFYHPATSLYLD